MLPDYNISGVLPPFLPGSSPTKPSSVSPYNISLYDFVDKFTINEERATIIRGLLEYRKQFISAGVTQGFQWIDGSFVENCEDVRKRPPGDIDIITFSRAPNHFSDHDWITFFRSRPDLFNSKISKRIYHCDAYFVDLKTDPLFLIDAIRYWFGLFTHQKYTFLWKGMIQIPLIDNDIGAITLLDYICFLQGWGAYA